MLFVGQNISQWSQDKTTHRTPYKSWKQSIWSRFTFEWCWEHSYRASLQNSETKRCLWKKSNVSSAIPIWGIYELLPPALLPELSTTAAKLPELPKLIRAAAKLVCVRRARFIQFTKIIQFDEPGGDTKDAKQTGEQIPMINKMEDNIVLWRLYWWKWVLGYNLFECHYVNIVGNIWCFIWRCIINIIWFLINIIWVLDQSYKYSWLTNIHKSIIKLKGIDIIIHLSPPF